MFAVDTTMSLLHWVPFDGNAITRSSDIPTDIETLAPIFAGVEVQARSGLVKGVFKITTRRTFKKIKFHTNIFAWLRDNHIWMRATSLKSSNNRKIGWMVNAHPTYTNFSQAADELMDRLPDRPSLELTPHRLVWPREGQRPLITRCLKVTTSRDDALLTLDNMMSGLSSTPEKFKHHPTAEWKFVPFEGGDSLPDSAIEHLILRQNKYLHDYNNSVCVDNLQYIDKEMELNDHNGDSYKMTIRQWCMTALLIDDKPCIQSIAQIGISNRYHFVCKAEHLNQVRRLLDEYFDGLSDFYETAEAVHAITGCDDPPWRSGRMNLTHGIDDYIRSLNLPSDGNDAFVSIVTEPHREPPSKQRRIPLTTGKDAKLPKGSDWDNPLFPKPGQSSQSPPSTPKRTRRNTQSDATSTTSGMSTEFTRVDEELERIQKMLLSSNTKNAESLKNLETSFSIRLEQTTAIVNTVATGQADIHTQLNTIHTNITAMNTANSLLSDTLHNKMETLTDQVAGLASLISQQFGGPSQDQAHIHRTLVTHTHNSINDLGLPPPLNQRNSPTHNSTQMDISGGVSG